ncbi:hypothetical protein DFH09DRAFT_1077839 [Mycena vulgaris]|nr:hypothetical protein DFH09DRAFT_1077839 [Mycena vulgaris]
MQAKRKEALEMVQIRHIDYEAKHVTFRDPATGRPITRILDITSAPDHTSEAEMAEWRSVLQDGLVTPIDEDEFITFIKALGTNQNDQKKLARLVNEGTTEAEKIMLGKKYLSRNDIQHYLPEITRPKDQKIQDAGSLDAWNALSEAEKEVLWAHFGEAEWKDLTPEARFEAQALVWCGCCMHEEMSSVRGGVQGIKLFWETIGGPVPVKLMNKGDGAAVSKS